MHQSRPKHGLRTRLVIIMTGLILGTCLVSVATMLTINHVLDDAADRERLEAAVTATRKSLDQQQRSIAAALLVISRDDYLVTTLRYLRNLRGASLETEAYRRLLADDSRDLETSLRQFAQRHGFDRVAILDDDGAPWLTFESKWPSESRPIQPKNITDPNPSGQGNTTAKSASLNSEPGHSPGVDEAFAADKPEDRVRLTHGRRSENLIWSGEIPLTFGVTPGSPGESLGRLQVERTLDDAYVKELATLTHTELAIFCTSGLTLSSLSADFTRPDHSYLAELKLDCGTRTSVVDTHEVALGEENYIRAVMVLCQKGKPLGNIVFYLSRGHEAQEDRLLLFGMFLVVAVCFLLSLPVATFLATRLTSPLQLLTEGAKSFQNDRFLPIRIDTNDELADLAETFNQMADHVHGHIQALNMSREAIQKEIANRANVEVSLRESLREKEVLLKEVHHRVKNNMQIISSLLSLQAGRMDDPKVKSIFADCQNRIKSMSLVHESIYRSNDMGRIDFSAYLGELLQGLLQSQLLPETGIAFDIRAKNLTLDLNTAIPCGLIVNELVTNSLKHAFPRGRSGRIEITGDISAGICALRVTDDGVGLTSGTSEPHNGGLGLLIVQVLVKQLGGVSRWEANSGTSFVFEFPVNQASLPENR